MSGRIHHQDSIFPGLSIPNSIREKESSHTAWNPLLNETSLTSSIGDFCASQRCQPTERCSNAVNSARNLCEKNTRFPNCAGAYADGHFKHGSGLSTSKFKGMPASSVFPSPTNISKKCSIVGTDKLTKTGVPIPLMNMQAQPQSLEASECPSGLKQRHSFLTLPEQAYPMQYRPSKRETQNPWQFSNESYRDSNPFQISQKEELRQQDCLFNVPPAMPNQRSILNLLPQTNKKKMQSLMPSKVDLHDPSKRIAGDCKSKTMRKEVMKLQTILYLCKHTLGCAKGCDRLDCKVMEQILNHCLSCHNNSCEQLCAPYKKLLGHYEECCKSGCSICPPAKIKLGNLRMLNSENTKVTTSCHASTCKQNPVKLTKKGFASSPGSSCASEVIDIDQATHTCISQNQKLRTFDSNSERLKLVINQSSVVAMVDNWKGFEPDVKCLKYAARSLLEVNRSSLRNAAEDRLQTLQTSSSLSCKIETVKELSSTECAYSSSQLAILENQDFITPNKVCIEEGMELEGKPNGNQDSNERSKTEPHIQGKMIKTSINYNVKDMMGEHNCSESISDASMMKYSELKLEGLNMDIEVHHNADSISSEVTAAQNEKHVKQKCYESEAEVHGTSHSLRGLKLKNETKKAISLLNLFTLEELREHISSLRQPLNLDKVAKKMIWPETQKINPCNLCGMDKLLFQPPLRYCSACAKQINPHGIYYSIKYFDNIDSSMGESYSFCNPCYIASKENIQFDKQSIPKVHLEQRANFTESDAISEEIVQCHKCKEWQHEICALFNGKLNKEKSSQTKFTCPICCIKEVENGTCEPLLPGFVRAMELPKTKLSDHIEQWLFKRLGEERIERANILGKSINEVPTAKNLTVRVVSSVDKKFKVKPCFYEIFQEEKYPVDFAYQSKAVMLFQVIEGVDVLIFAMFVQEYGSDCSRPNRRQVCISYIDSVKYFRPEVRTVSGEALRTFVYHEFLIGYLDYCKRRCFTSCYIWACPPSKNDDYILHCHPKTQKIPKADKLRDWYQKMIKKALQEKIVVEVTNLYDHFFVQTSEFKGNITAAHLPYFDKDYWPEEAESLLQKYSGNKSKQTEKVAKAVIERALRAARRDATFIKNEKDVLLMNKLGDTIGPMKDDFIILYLQQTCRHCRKPIIFGGRWVCNTCKNFQLCKRCHNIDGKLRYKDRHPMKARDKHSFHRVDLENFLRDTTDEDETQLCEIFNTRLEFLNFCEGNHYQFDTLRRAKHSTMMVLHYLHNPAPFDFESSHCDGMNNAYQHNSDHHEECHPQHSLLLDTQLQGDKVRALMVALLHASRCGGRGCTLAHCRQLKAVFRHGVACRVRKKGGCELCAKMWCLIFLHSRSCRQPECSVPRCKDVKERFGGTSNAPLIGGKRDRTDDREAELPKAKRSFLRVGGS